MGAIECTRRIQFCAGHRVMGHENKCAHLHGHNYVVMVTAKASRRMSLVDTGLDPIGRVVDFSVLKDRVGGWIEQHWDHGFILNDRDAVAIEALAVFDSLRRRYPPFEAQKLFRLPMNPTAENMAHYLLHTVGPEVLEGTGVHLVRVVVHETENCSAEAKA